MATTAGERWRILRRGAAAVDVEYGSSSTTLYGTEFRMRKGPPVTVSFSLERGLRGRSKEVGTYLDAKTLAEGEIRRLTQVHFRDEQVITWLRRFSEDASGPWRLAVTLGNRQHEFTIEPEYRGDRSLVMRVQGSHHDKTGGPNRKPKKIARRGGIKRKKGGR